MFSKLRKFIFPRWLNSKAKGELAESIFLFKAQALGLAVSKPYGDNRPFDFHVQSRIGTFRVQVKSAWKLGRSRYLSIPTKYRPESKGYDVMVVYVAPLDVWYVIPAHTITGHSLTVYPKTAHRAGKYERYREGWRTLTGDVHDDTRRIGLEIHAGRSS